MMKSVFEIPDKIRRGKKGSIRIDVLEKVHQQMVCVYDIKTGRSGLSPARIGEISKSVAKHFGAANFTIIEIRPNSSINGSY
ncbi:hypothetical protein HB779_10000 [Phyllobacterium sp. 628]|uniref:hypothetical protein n=1 Tax=Phyllobacterium sp. 628 TaxID=2718938 RepID=UPI00166252E2|nr:hypothetical protein [Phyllobacterium sp. 628]QND52206.1 hypothetical protein HB779_10000 [Phyllobacterium sp. 628]